MRELEEPKELLPIDGCECGCNKKKGKSND